MSKAAKKAVRRARTAQRVSAMSVEWVQMRIGNLEVAAFVEWLGRGSVPSVFSRPEWDYEARRQVFARARDQLDQYMHLALRSDAT